MAVNDNIILKTSTTKTIDNLLQSDGVTANIANNTAGTAISPGTVYFTSDGHIIYDLDSSHRLWMGKDALTSTYSQTAMKLETARTIQTDLESTSSASFDGSNNITPGVMGTLPVSNGGTGVTTVDDIFATYGVEYIEGTQTASTGAWTGVTKSASLYIGKTIAYKLPYTGSGNATLTLTLADGVNTAGGAVYAGNTRLTTHYPANSIMIMVWNGTNWRTNPYYNTNTNTLLRVYSSATNLDVPLIGQSSASNTTAAWTSYTGTYKDWYGAIPNDDTKRAKIGLYSEDI